MRIAIIYDYLTQFGGGERVLSCFCELFNQAPIFTLIYNKKATGYVFEDREIHTSFLQKIPGSKKYFRFLVPLMPMAIEQFNLSKFDLVFSISTSYAKGVITKPETVHISYCSTPPRYLWHFSQESLNDFIPFKILKLFSQAIFTYLRIWDFQSVSRVDKFIASSENVKKRIKKYYNRESEVIYPPVDSKKFYISNKPKNYFLMVGRMVPYKRFDLGIEVFLKLKSENLIVIGWGPEYKKLRSRVQKAGANNIKFLGQVSDRELSEYYANSKALIFPQDEDFGIVPLESMASGRPVIAFRSGGALESIVENETGIFFNQQNIDSLIEAIKGFKEKEFNPQKIRQHSLNFDKDNFKNKILKIINELTY